MTKAIKKFNKKKKIIIGALILGFIALALPLALIAMRAQTNIAPKAATTDKGSNLVLASKEKIVAKNKQFNVSVRLNNSEDMSYVVTGVDAIIKYDPAVLEAIKITKGKVFSSLSSKKINKKTGTIRISGSYSKIKDEKGFPIGYEGNGGNVAVISFKTKKKGKTNLSFVYNGGQATSDSNIIAFKKGTLVSKQSPQERFLKKPVNLAMSVGPVPTPVPQLMRCNDTCLSDKGCMATNSQWRCLSVPETSNKKCRLPSNTSSRLCEPKKDDAVCATDVKECSDGSYVSRSGPNCSFAKCPILPPPPSLPPTPKPTPMPRPEAQIRIELSSLAMLKQGPGEYNLSEGISSDFDSGTSPLVKGTLYGVEASRVKGVMIAATDLGDLNVINMNANDAVDAPGMDGGAFMPPPPRLEKIADFTASYNKPISVAIPQRFEGKRMQFFVRTQSHLMKAGNKTAVIQRIPDCLWSGAEVCVMGTVMPTLVKFNNLVAGDIYIANKQSAQDNIINTFDALELVSSFGDQPDMTTSIQCFTTPCPDSRQAFLLNKADLNADLVVNVRDLKILMDNLGKVGSKPRF